MLFAADSQKPFPGVRKGDFSIEEVNYSKSQQIFHDLPEFWLKRLLIQT